MVAIWTGSMLESVKITSQKYLDSGRISVHFDPNLFGSQMAPIFVIFCCRIVIFTYQPHHTSTTLLSPCPPDITQGCYQNKEVEESREGQPLQSSPRRIHRHWRPLPRQHQDGASGAFCHCPVKNFHRNYKDISAAFELEAKYSCTPRIACGVCYC